MGAAAKDALESYCAGEVQVITEEGLVQVPCAAFTAEDFAIALAATKQVYRRNKRDTFVLHNLEKRVAEQALARVGKLHGWTVKPYPDDDKD